MTNLTTKLNKLMLDDSPSEKLINASSSFLCESVRVTGESSSANS